MNSSPPTPPPTNTKTQDAASEGKRQREDLSHLGWKGKTDENIRLKQSFIDWLVERIENLTRATKDKSKKAADEPAPVLSAEDIERRKKYKKRLVISAIALPFVLLAVIIVPNISDQVQRSKGFAAFQQGDYEKASLELELYLANQPNDFAARFVVAQAALYAGNVSGARNTINDLYAKQLLPNEPVGYFYALLHLDRSDVSLPALDAVLDDFPDHAAARLLRGIMMGQEENAARAARDDFLQLAERMYGGDEGKGEQIRFLHRHLQQNAYPPLLQNVALNEDKTGEKVTRAEHVFRVLGMYPGLEGFVYRLQYSVAEEFFNEALSTEDIVNLYFSYMLIKQGELSEADSILTGLLRNRPNSFAIQQAMGFLKIYQGAYDEAAQQFSVLADQLPMDSPTLNNRVVANLLENGATADWAAMTEAYRELLKTGSTGELGLTNGFYTAILQNDVPLAQQIQDKITAAEYASPHIALSQSLLALLTEKTAEAAALLESAEREKLPALDRYLAAIDIRLGRLDAAIDLLATMEGDDVFIERMQLMRQNNDWRLALVNLVDFVELNPTHYQARYLLGDTALILQESEIVAEQQAVLNELRESEASDAHYAYALEGRQLWQQNQKEAALAAYEMAVLLSQGKQRTAYLIDWVPLFEEQIPADKVLPLLTEALEEAYAPELDALLAYLFADSAPQQVVAHAERVAGNKGYVILTYAGGALLKVGILPEAILMLQEAVNAYPGQPLPLRFLQQGYQSSGEVEKAARVGQTLDYLAAVARGEGPPVNASYKIYLPNIRALIIKVQAAIGSGAAEAGELAYAEALAGEEDSQRRGDILYSQATFSAYNKEYEKAAEQFEQALALGFAEQEKQVKIMLFYAEVLSLLERFQASADVLAQVIEIEGKQPLYMRLYALALANNNQYEPAEAQMTELLALYPIDVPGYQAFADIYTMSGKYSPEVIGVLKKLLFVNPLYSEAYKQLEDTYRIIENESMAARYARAYLSLQDI